MNRDETAKIYEAHYMRVFSYAMTLTGDRALSEEITQETFSGRSPGTGNTGRNRTR